MSLSTVRRRGTTATKPPTLARHAPRSRALLWQALRQLRTSSARELAAVTQRPKNSIQVDLRYLVRTGYARVHGEDLDAVYTLIRDTGPLPPLFVGRRDEILCAVDRNTHRHFGVDGNPPPTPEELPLLRRWMPKGKPPRQRKHKHWRGPERKMIVPHLVARERRKRERGE
jgi:hypothetical protein